MGKVKFCVKQLFFREIWKSHQTLDVITFSNDSKVTLSFEMYFFAQFFNYFTRIIFNTNDEGWTIRLNNYHKILKDILHIKLFVSLLNKRRKTPLTELCNRINYYDVKVHA